MKQVNQEKNGAKFLADTAHWKSHDKCLWAARMRRDEVASHIPEWEQMRLLASSIKRHTLSNLDVYLEEFEKNATANGIHVHWAKDADEHNAIVYDIFKSHNVKIVTKGKSMLMDECGMREYMGERGIQIFEADLGERIQQLSNERASHIVMPAIHKLRGDVATLFAQHMGSDSKNDDPHYLNSVMREDMRKNYIKVDAGMSGVNFAIAETGGIVVCTNEGNADISACVPPLYVVSMGIEKLIPRAQDVPLFVRLLSRSALGFHVTQYTSHYHGPRQGQEMHIVIVDNGRTDRLPTPGYSEVLKCIRCSACLNTCPVFRRTGGLSYDAPYMGPIGIVLQPSYDLHRYAQLPYACTHCGSCANVCPVHVPIPNLVFRWRNIIVDKKEDLLAHRLEMDISDKVLKSEYRLAWAEKVALAALRHLPKGLMESKINPWAAEHSNPEAPEQTFREYYKKEQEQQSDEPKQ